MDLEQIFFTKNVITKVKLSLLFGSKKLEDFLVHSLIFLGQMMGHLKKKAVIHFYSH
jgi:hypothetical protein